MHEIRLKRNGALVFLDHDYATLRAETELRITANLPPAHRCEVILRRWRDQWHSAKIEREAIQAGISCSMPKELDQARWRIGYRQNPRLVDCSGLRTWTGDNDWRGRLADRIQREAREALDRADYRRSESTWAGGDHEILVEIAENERQIRITGESKRAWSSNRKWSGSNSVITARVQLTWLHVARRGLALVPDKDGKHHFVLALHPQKDLISVRTGRSVLRPGEVVAIVGKQGRGFDVKAEHAIINTVTARLVRWQTNNHAIGNRQTLQSV
jgi:hypothetical protein